MEFSPIFCQAEIRICFYILATASTSFRFKALFSTAAHPQTDGQSERTIQTLEDMLRACVLDFKGIWDHYLALIEFTYNNSYQKTIGIAPYEALYRQKCHTLLY